MQHVNTAHTHEPRTTAKWAVAMLVAIASLLILVSGPQVAKAAVGGPAFPRTAVWWPDNDRQSVAARANCDWIALQAQDSGHIAELRAANPSILILGSTNAREVNYGLTTSGWNQVLNAEVRKVSTDWMLTQVGTTLTSNVTTSATTIPVADVTKFAVGEMVLVDHELMRVEAIGTSSLTVMARGPVTPAAAHLAGARIASVVTNWSGSITMDLTTNCPKRDVGYGLETWSDWNVRRASGVLHAANWDGLLIDCLEGNTSWMVSGGNNRSIDLNRTNIAVTDGYAAFNTAWNNGAAAYGDAMRAMAGTKLLIGNGNMRNYSMNGNIFEEFPYATLSPSIWATVFVGPYDYPRASYPEWCANAAGQNLTMVQTYGAQTNYQLMRYGLCSTLMDNGYFSYALSSSGHAVNGIWNYDEYDNAGAGRGYLGQPTGAAVQVGAAWRRDFANGISLVNPTASAITIQLGGSFTKINGTQDRTVNDGTTVTSVTLQPRDGIILLRPVVAPPADTTAPVTTSDAKATYVSSAAIKLAATDNVGVTATYFMLDGGAQTAGATINVTAAGSHTIQFWSVDAAGNVEVKKSATFTITVSLPTGTMTIAAGSARVTSPDVAIASSVSGAADMRTDPGTGAFGSWMTYAPTTHVTLAGGYGTNMVRVEYRNAGGTFQLIGTIDLIEVVTPVDPPVVPVDPPVVPTQTVDPTHTVDPTQTVIPVVTLTASTTTLGYGSSGTLRIAVAPMSNMSVRIEQRTATNPQWAEVTTTVAGLDGTVQLTVRPLLTTDYRAVLADTGVVSNSVTVSVKALATVKSSKKTIRRRNSVTMSGKVTTSPSGTAAMVGVASAYSAPAATKVSAALQRNVHGKWVTVKRLSVSASGSYHVHIRPLARRRYSYRVRVASSATNAVGVSRTIRIRVR